MKIILVTGGRHYKDQKFVWSVLTRAHQDLGDFITLTGACPSGVDAFAEQWAVAHQLPYIGVPAQWHKHSNGAGPFRNKQMLRMFAVDYGIVFPGMSGTRHMQGLLVAAKIPVWEVARRVAV